MQSRDGQKRLDDVDRVDLAALAVLRAWGVSDNGVVYVKVEPCDRPHCAGSHVSGWGGTCMLCAR